MRYEIQIKMLITLYNLSVIIISDYIPFFNPIQIQNGLKNKFQYHQYIINAFTHAENLNDSNLIIDYSYRAFIPIGQSEY